ncbi:MAG: flagellar hook-associated protein FlgL [Pseudomonadota bacterium]
MRVTDKAAFDQGVAGLQRLQASLNELQQQLATGRQILRPSDDPLGASRTLEIQDSISRLDQFERNNELATNRLRLKESSLATTTEYLQRARELALQAANATQTNETRGFIAAELRGLLDGILAVANTRDDGGQYLFGGFQTGQTPFTRTASGFQYNGDQGRREVQIGQSRRIVDAEPGDRIFGRLREGNGQITAAPAAANTGTGVITINNGSRVASYDYEAYTIEFVAPDTFEVRDDGGALVSTGPFSPDDNIEIGDLAFKIAGVPAAGDVFDVTPSAQTDVFTVLDNLASALEAGSPNGETTPQLQTATDAGLAGLDQALNTILGVRSELGVRLSVAETELDRSASTKLLLQEQLANLQDLDYTAAISALTQQTTALEAAQQSFVRIQGLSLFDLL